MPACGIGKPRLGYPQLPNQHAAKWGSDQSKAAAYGKLRVCVFYLPMVRSFPWVLVILNRMMMPLLSAVASQLRVTLTGTASK